MSSYDNLDYMQGLVSELRKLPAETGWVEFKENNSNPQDVGESLSALSNTAALNGKPNAYLVWGIRDQTHEVTGTTFRNPMTNSSLRERFGIEKQNSAIASRIIRDAVEDGRVKAFNPEQGKKHAKYVPFWA